MNPKITAMIFRILLLMLMIGKIEVKAKTKERRTRILVLPNVPRRTKPVKNVPTILPIVESAEKRPMVLPEVLTSSMLRRVA